MSSDFDFGAAEKDRRGPPPDNLGRLGLIVLAFALIVMAVAYGLRLM